MFPINLADVDALLDAAKLVSGCDVILIVAGKRADDGGLTNVRTYTTGTYGHDESAYILGRVSEKPRLRNLLQWPER